LTILLTIVLHLSKSLTVLIAYAHILDWEAFDSTLSE